MIALQQQSTCWMPNHGCVWILNRFNKSRGHRLFAEAEGTVNGSTHFIPISHVILENLNFSLY